MLTRQRLLVAAMAALLLCPVAQAQEKLTILFPTRSDAKDLKQKAEAVAAILAKDLNIPVDAVVTDETASVEALRANRADVAFLSSRAALKAEQLAGARVYLAEIRPNYSGGYTYRSLMVVRQDSPLQPQKTVKATLSQLQGKKIAFASRTSTSGYFFPMGELIKVGLASSPDRLEDFFGNGNVFYGDGYSSALQAVLRKQADVATVSEYALFPPYLKPEEAEQLRVLYYIPGVPAHGVVIDDDVAPALREKLIQAFLNLNKGPANELFRSLYNSTTLVRVDHDQHLQPTREVLKSAKIDP